MIVGVYSQSFTVSMQELVKIVDDLAEAASVETKVNGEDNVLCLAHNDGIRRLAQLLKDSFLNEIDKRQYAMNNGGEE